MKREPRTLDGSSVLQQCRLWGWLRRACDAVLEVALPNSALLAKPGNGGELRLSGGRKAHSLITRSGCPDRGHACENPHSACCSRARSFVNLYRPRAWPVHYTPCLNTLREVVGGWVVAVEEEGMCGRERVMVRIVTERVTSLR